MTVKYKLDHFFGEPTVNGSYKWEAGYNTESDCLPSGLVIWLVLESPSGAYGHVRLAPVVPDAGEGYGYNVTGSPNWDSYACGYSGTRVTECLGEDGAKALYKSGRVSGFRLSHR